MRLLKKLVFCLNLVFPVIWCNNSEAARKFTAQNPMARCVMHFNEGSGSYTYDQVRNTSGTLIGAVAWVSGNKTNTSPEVLFPTSTWSNIQGNALSFTQTVGLFVEVSTAPGYLLIAKDQTIAFTYSLDAYRTNYGGGLISLTRIGGACGAGAPVGWAIDVDASNRINYTACGIAGNNEPYRIHDFAKHRFVITYDDANQIVRYYVDGKIDSTQSQSRVADETNPVLRFFERNNTGHFECGGVIDEFGIFQEKWNDDDVLDDYEDNSVNGTVVVSGAR